MQNLARLFAKAKNSQASLTRPRASMRNTNFKKYAGLFRQPPNVANWIRLRRATSNAHVFYKISYAGLSKWSQRGGLENRLPNRHGGSNPSACAIKTNTIPRGWCLFLSRRTRGREPTSATFCCRMGFAFQARRKRSLIKPSRRNIQSHSLKYDVSAPRLFYNVVHSLHLLLA